MEEHKDYLAAIPQLNDKQKDELVESTSFGIKKISIGIEILLFLIGVGLIICSAAIGFMVGEYIIRFFFKT